MTEVGPTGRLSRSDYAADLPGYDIYVSLVRLKSVDLFGSAIAGYVTENNTYLSFVRLNR